VRSWKKGVNTCRGVAFQHDRKRNAGGKKEGQSLFAKMSTFHRLMEKRITGAEERNEELEGEGPKRGSNLLRIKERNREPANGTHEQTNVGEGKKTENERFGIQT